MATTEEFKNGGSTSYPFTIEYIKAEDIKVEIDGTALTYTTNASPASGEYKVVSTTVTLGATAAAGTGNVHIYRLTDVDTAAATFAAGSSIRAADLNACHDMVRLASQEQHQLLRTGDLKSQSITSDKIADGTIVNADVNASAAIEGSKLQASSGSVAGSMSTANFTKLAGIETNATQDQTSSEIRALVDSATDSNVFTDSLKTKLDGVATNADVTSTKAVGDLTDVNTTGVANGKILKYSNISNAFIIADDSSGEATNFSIATLSPAFDGTTTAFTVTNAPFTAQQLLISIDGVIQKPNSGTGSPSEGFTLSGSTVTFSAAPDSGSNYHVVVFGSAFNVGNGSITDAKLDTSISAAITANTVKITNATHTGDVTGSGVLTIANDAVTTDKLADSINTAIAANTAKTTNATHTGDVTGDTSLTITDGAVTQAKLNFPLSNRNLIINGDMQVAQRGTSSTTNGFGSVDRFSVANANLDAAPTHAQVDLATSDLPFTKGLTKALKVTNGNQTSIGSNDQLLIITKLEAHDIRNSGWNYLSSSSYITLSFYVKSSVSQNFFGRLVTDDGTLQSYPFETGSLTSGTWTKITKTIPGNSNLTFDNDSGSGLQIIFCLFEGTDHTDNTVSSNAWGAYADTTRTADQDSTWLGQNAVTFEITGVQLEVGNVATEFEHISFADNLRKCQRYYFRGDGQNLGATLDRYFSSGYASGGSMIHVSIPTTMRTKPTVTTPTLNSSGTLAAKYENLTQVSYYITGDTSSSIEASDVEFSSEL